MYLEFFGKLSQNFVELLNDKDDYNVIIEVENKEKSFTAHSNVMKFRSSYFRRELENIKPNENNIKIIIKPSISAQIFDVILQYIYGGIVHLENTETKFIFDLMLIANEFEFEELTNKLETFFIETKEVKIWDYVIKWGIAQNSTLPPNLEEWTKENFLTLKITLQQCLPHIRYFNLSSIEVVDKIKPYKKIIDKQLWEDINQHLLIPDRPIKSTILPPRSVLVIELPPRAQEPREPFSTIISEEHAAKISAWIDRKTTAYTLTNIPYKFELILRGTRDGFAPQTFWNICHGHVCTVVIVNAAETDEIVGENGNIPNSILSRVENLKYAILNVRKSDQKYYGPYFGNDFWMSSNKSNFTIDTLDDGCFCNSCGDDYEKPIRSSSSSEYFSIINYEVFKIVKKTI
ncbi:hypothetical protein Glove_23g97 [Diversispora epigaea]|uniref:BTB domain-containing protein n=1 Tax=Diversispora epigaea TaxID=1348612 RepID=A0A397JU30_9GLOM|nr:hypothetical protein Glove_23g97 [Diversispora epigaea]